MIQNRVTHFAILTIFFYKKVRFCVRTALKNRHRKSTKKNHTTLNNLTNFNHLQLILHIQSCSKSQKNLLHLQTYRKNHHQHHHQLHKRHSISSIDFVSIRLKLFPCVVVSAHNMRENSGNVIKFVAWDFPSFCTNTMMTCEKEKSFDFNPAVMVNNFHSRGKYSMDSYFR